MSVVTVIWKGVNSSSDIGYLRLSTRIGNKTKLKSLPIPPIKKSHFSKSRQCVLSSCVNYQEYNLIIDQKLEEAKRKGGNLSLINDDNKSLLHFLNNIIKRISNPGTQLKYKNILNLLVKFNQENNGDLDVKFSHITIGFIAEFQRWLRVENRNSQNTVSYKIKTFKSLVNKAIKQGEYNYYTDPFSEFKIKINDKKVQILDKDSLLSLISTPLEEVYRGKDRFGEIISSKEVLEDKRYIHSLSLDDYRNFFVFQVYSMGIRVSDLLTLRYNNFIEVNGTLRLKKVMLKTQNEISTKVNSQMLDLLFKYVPFVDYKIKRELDELFPRINHLKKNPINEETKLYTGIISRRSIVWEYLTNKDIEPAFNPENDMQEGFLVSLKELNSLKSNIDNDFKNIEDSVVFEGENEDELVSYKFVNKEDENTSNSIQILIKKMEGVFTKELKDYNDTLLNLIEKKNQLISKVILNCARDREFSNLFCFPLLKNEDFNDIDENNDFGAMNHLQYKRFTGARAYYNRLLKPIAKQCGLEVNLSTHIARHSYTSLMLELGENVNLIDLMISLGHKHVTTTQRYIQRFTTEKVDSLNDKLSNFL